MSHQNDQNSNVRYFVSVLLMDAKMNNRTPLETFRDWVEHMPPQLSETLPRFLFDSKKTTEERYDLLCAAAADADSAEADRRAAFRAKLDTPETQALSCLLSDEADVFLTLLPTGDATYFLGVYNNDFASVGVTLVGAHATGPVHQMLRHDSVELTRDADGSPLLIAAARQGGEVRIVFTAATPETRLYDYAHTLTHQNSLYPAWLLLVHRLCKLAEKATDTICEFPFTDAELELLPLAVGAGLLLGQTDCLRVTAEHLESGKHAALSMFAGQNLQNVCGNAYRNAALACADKTAAHLFARLAEAEDVGTFSMRRTLAALASHIRSVHGEKLIRFLDERLAEATCSYLPPSAALCGGEVLAAATVETDAVFSDAGFTGTAPHYRKEVTLDRPALFLWNDTDARILPRGTRLLCMVDVYPFSDYGGWNLLFSAATVVLGRGEENDRYVDSDVLSFGRPCRRRSGQKFYAVLSRAGQMDTETLTAAETAVCVAKYVTLVPLSAREHLLVYFASGRTTRRRARLLAGWRVVTGGLLGAALGLAAARLFPGVKTTLMTVAALVGAAIRLFPMWLARLYKKRAVCNETEEESE